MQIAGFEWDSGNWPKWGKHGVNRQEIERLFLEGQARIAPERTHSTSAESRHIAAGRVEGRALFVVFALRGHRIRPISARYMHKKEALRYEAST